ncbi:MAG: relaxase/mobilization nuclease domain-containing protein [Microcoleus sp. PH2017_10_PVI_O_A]|uniref:relaxase/mobilization nuclease domain-containing protein n=1 Tax=unclassified Microcoleus TaxID=2642155 RepID=UPI001DFC9D04|nr:MULTISPECIES: relaxase/mobilization nuclease domain-containing protein [unclassified Microcoleus]MCC3407963.1 relaxase/mobilization nuclease domain-containing protein [Microcoleus sp. PH2017_10_PVI_O_A]MCC3462134.1 relaxase/mobilization nuclease domain-containing protein [Microcoleus sp. PH2017_11_PCY_U_A]MCC3480567.1 relaxase/mobilization nuclease domain-containing protein [Microcoleus sp. PH2017_12_PCY_D_A]MCC3529952.1 relaxase/mobilization nuclease domain-containing protein [Microcoleus s
MIGKQIKGTGFRGCLNYVLGKKDATLIGGTMCGQTPEELAAEFGIARQLRPNLKVAVFHATLSVDSTEKLEDSEENDQRWLTIAANYMKAMEFDNNQYAVVKHSDTEHDHIHIVASRICLDGGVVDDSWDYYKSQETIRQLERNYSLETVTPSWETDKRAQTTGEHRQLKSKGNKSIRVQLQDLIDEVTQDNPSMPEFVERLQQQAVEVQVGLTQNGFTQGISYNLDGVALSGTQLGKAYTFSGLQKHRGVSYDKGRDNALIEALMQPQHLAIAPNEAEENELESSQSELAATLSATANELELSQSELETTTPATPATANELELPQSELAAIAPATSATANELELQLSILPEKNETQWARVRSHLAVEYSLPLELLNLLHSHSWLYAGSEKAVFTARTLEGEARFAFVLDELGNFTTTHPLSSEAAFWVATTGEIERAVIACNPIKALSILLIEQDNSTTAPATLYLGIERASQLPIQFLQELDSVIIALAEDSHLARNASELLPNAEVINPQSSWNDIWIQLIELEQQTHKQNNQQYKQRIQDIELD